MLDMKDEELMVTFKEGDEKAFKKLVDKYRDRLIRYMGKYIKDYDRAEELCQELFIRVCKNVKNYSVKSKLATYLYRIAFNLSYNEIRNRYRRKTDAMESVYVSDNITPEFLHVRSEMGRAIRNRISLLSPKYKEVVMMCGVAI